MGRRGNVRIYLLALGLLGTAGYLVSAMLYELSGATLLALGFLALALICLVGTWRCLSLR